MEMKSNHQLQREMNRLDLRGFIEVQRRYGRHYLPQEVRSEWVEKHTWSKDVAADSSYEPLTREMARLLSEITFFVGTVPLGAPPDYYQYTDSRLLDWYLEPDSRNVEHIRRSALAGLFVVIEDLLAFETRSLNGLESHHRDNFSRVSVEERIPLANHFLSHLVREGFTDGETQTVALESLEDYVRASSRLHVLRHLMCVPLTQNHDEVLFIRVLHGSELCFLGIRVLVASAIEALKAREVEVALRRVHEATEFAQLLMRLLRLLRTMPVAHFAAFRQLTDGASALQSIGFHLMDVLLNGVNTDKIAYMKRVPHLRPVIRFCDQRFVSLKQIMNLTEENNPEWHEIRAACRILDKELLTWRGLHVSFARLYIPGGVRGTGGTEGAAYLRQHLFRGMFDDHEPDWQALREMFPEVELRNPRERVRSGVMVVP